MAIRVLVVEDSPLARHTLCEWLDGAGGFQVVGVVASEMAATEWFQNHQGDWDLAILDLMIEGGSGFNLIRRAKQSSQSGKAVVFSAYATPVVAQRCIDLGAEAAFGKSEPEDFLAYLAALNAVNDGSAQRPQ